MIDYADKDRDGVINYDEFVNIVTKQYPKVWWCISINEHNIFSYPPILYLFKFEYWMNSFISLNNIDWFYK